jgi:hypothetical protein
MNTDPAHPAYRAAAAMLVASPTISDRVHDAPAWTLARIARAERVAEHRKHCSVAQRTRPKPLLPWLAVRFVCPAH